MNLVDLKCPTCGYPIPETSRANELFKCPACNNTLYLNNLKIGHGRDDVAIATATRVYHVADLLGRDDVASSYRCHYKLGDADRQGIFRIARDAADNDLAQNEAQVLYHLQASPGYDEFRHFVPLMLESFGYQDADAPAMLHVNIIGLHETIKAPSELYTLEEVRQYYTTGVDPRDMAWMWRRILLALHFTHQQGVVHGAALPSHLLIEPTERKLLLSGWGFALRDVTANPKPLRAVSTTYEAWYPPEVFQKEPAATGLDIFMAARCALYLVGADPVHSSTHSALDQPLQQYFTRILEAKSSQRPQKAWDLLNEFDQIIDGLWGKRTFRVFQMPYKA